MTEESTKRRIIIRCFTFNEFCNEFIESLKEYPNAVLEGNWCGDNEDHNVFEFGAVLENKEQQ